MSRRTRKPSGPWWATLMVVLLSLLVPSVARAGDALRFSLDWEKLAAALGERALSLATPQRPPVGADQASGDAPLPWIGLSPHVSLVAHDWGMSQVLVGRATVGDQVRLSRSIRMAVARVRLTNGRLAPFAQLGIGQWRVDTSVLPTLPTDIELAGQLGAGFELALAPRLAVALEGDCTALYRETREPAALARAHFWGSLLAARATF